MEQDQSDSLILAATNFVKLLDPALFRRFDDVIEYGLPDKDQIKHVIQNRLHAFKLKSIHWDAVMMEAEGLSHGDLTRASDEAAKESILAGAPAISEALLLTAIRERKHSASDATPH
jgi:AAA+ superfamily predicted ATPase